MDRYFALLDGGPGAYGVAFPDCPGCTAMGASENEAYANAVAALGDALQCRRHRLAQLERTIIQLQRVGPAGEIRIAAMGEHTRPVLEALRATGDARPELVQHSLIAPQTLRHVN